VLTDPDIRQAVAQLVTAEVHRANRAIAVHEFSISAGFGFADIAVVADQLVGYEIKSDVDSLARLRRQVQTFSAVFDRMWLVTTERHLRSAIDVIPLWWGVLIASGKPVCLKRARNARAHADFNVPLILDLLYRDDLSRLATDLGCRRHSQLSKAELCHLVAARVTAKQARIRVRDFLHDERRYLAEQVIASVRDVGAEIELPLSHAVAS